MQRLVVEGNYVAGSLVSLNAEQSHFVRDVMRMRAGERIWLTNGIGDEGQAQIESISREGVVVVAESMERSKREASICVTVGQGMPKADKLEMVIQKCTELGAVAIWPLECARSIAQIDAKKEARKLERWNKIALEAAEQSHRAFVPNVSPPQSLKTLVKVMNQFDAVFIAAEVIGHRADSSEHGLRNALATFRSSLDNELDNRALQILILVGPEGGWTDAEVELLTQAGAVAVGLGNRILRTETAALVALSAIYYEFGEYGG